MIYVSKHIQWIYSYWKTTHSFAKTNHQLVKSSFKFIAVPSQTSQKPSSWLAKKTEKKASWCQPLFLLRFGFGGRKSNLTKGINWFSSITKTEQNSILWLSILKAVHNMKKSKYFCLRLAASKGARSRNSSLGIRLKATNPATLDRRKFLLWPVNGKPENVSTSSWITFRAARCILH